MERFLGRVSDVSYALLRFFAGAMYACHGAQKLFGAFGGIGIHVAPPSLLWFAGVIELGAGVLVAVGLGAGWAGFVAAGEMAVAYFMTHAPHGFWPIVNKGELAVVYCFVFLLVATRGDGRYSLGQLAVGERALHAP